MSVLDPNMVGDACIWQRIQRGWWLWKRIIKMATCLRCGQRFDEQGKAIINSNLVSYRVGPQYARCHHMQGGEGDGRT